MAPQAIRELLDAHAFQPFNMRFPERERVPVTKSDHAQFSPTGRRFIVFSDDDRMRIIDPILISELELATPQP